MNANDENASSSAALILSGQVLQPLLHQCVLDFVSLLRLRGTCSALRSTINENNGKIIKDTYQQAYGVVLPLETDATTALKFCIQRWLLEEDENCYLLNAKANNILHRSKQRKVEDRVASALLQKQVAACNALDCKRYMIAKHFSDKEANDRVVEPSCIYDDEWNDELCSDLVRKALARSTQFGTNIYYLASSTGPSANQQEQNSNKMEIKLVVYPRSRPLVRHELVLNVPSTIAAILAIMYNTAGDIAHEVIVNGTTTLAQKDTYVGTQRDCYPHEYFEFLEDILEGSPLLLPPTRHDKEREEEASSLLPVYKDRVSVFILTVGILCAGVPRAMKKSIFFKAEQWLSARNSVI